MKASLLGSGGFIPTQRRETISILVRLGDAALLPDAGTGLRRLLTEPERFAGVNATTSSSLTSTPTTSPDSATRGRCISY